MGGQAGDELLEPDLAGGVFRQRPGLKGGEELVPNGVQLVLRRVGVGRDDDHRVLVGQHEQELTAGAVAAIGVVGAAPELKAVTLPPIRADVGVGSW